MVACALETRQVRHRPFHLFPPIRREPFCVVKMRMMRAKGGFLPFAAKKHLERFDSIQLLIVYTYLRQRSYGLRRHLSCVSSACCSVNIIFNLRLLFSFFPSSFFGLCFLAAVWFLQAKNTRTQCDRKKYYYYYSLTQHTLHHHKSIYLSKDIYQSIPGARCVSMNQEILSASEDE